VGSSWRRWRTLLRTLSLPVALGLVGCGSLPQTLFAPVGDVARTQLHLLQLTTWIVSGIFVLVFGLLLYTLIRFRARAGAPTPKEIHGSHSLEVLWTIIPIIILAIISVPTVKDAFQLGDIPTGADVVHVKVIGHQWWWEFQYPDLGVVTANEIHIPVGKKVALEITSADVIHSFWLPRIAGKTDVVPNRLNHMWIDVDPDKAGVYYGQCAEFCGDSHANMRMRAVAQSQADFDAWVQQWKTGEVKPAAGSPATVGEALFMGGKRDNGNAMPCFTCHAINNTKAEGKVGPNLTLLGQRTIVAAGTLDNTPENVANWLHDPQAVKPGALMPNLSITKAESDALVAFLESQK